MLFSSERQQSNEKMKIQQLKKRMELLWQLAVQQLQTLETVSLNNLPKLGVDLHKG